MNRGSDRTEAIPSHSFRSELKLTARLGGPLALGELGWMSTYIVDAIMVGRMPHSALAIAGSSLGNSIFYAILFAGVGLLFGLDTLVSQAFGRGDAEDGLFSLVQSLFVVAICTPAVMVLSTLTPHALTLFHVDPQILAVTNTYMASLRWSAAPLLLYMAVRHYLQAIDRPGWVMVSLLTANLVNWLGDWLFIYGHWGFHAQGIAGSGWATCLVRVYMLALLVTSLAISLRKTPIRLRANAWRPDWSRLHELYKVGWPIGLQWFGDLSLASFSTVLTSTLGVAMLAANQVVIDVNAFCSMIPLGIQAASAVRTGQGAGRSDGAQVRRAGFAGIALSGGSMLVASLLFIAAPRFWGSIYTNDPAVVAAAVPVFYVCAAYRVFDGIQIVLVGALRGMGYTQLPFYASAGCVWLIGVPVSAFFVFRMHWQLVGNWLGGLVSSLLLFAIITLSWYARVRQYGPNRPERRRVARTVPFEPRLAQQ